MRIQPWLRTAVAVLPSAILGCPPYRLIPHRVSIDRLKVVDEFPEPPLRRRRRRSIRIAELRSQLHSGAQI